MNTKLTNTKVSAIDASQPGIAWLVGVTAMTMVAFAANSLLTRLALQTTSIDPATFTGIRLIAGAACLALLCVLRGQRLSATTQALGSAVLLFIYVVAFSFAYRGMDTGAGALVLFASAQLLMIGAGYWRGEKTNLWGVLLALAGLVVFLAPSDAAPPLGYSILMLVAGIAWGGYSLLGRSGDDPVLGTANSFVLTLPLLVILFLFQRHALHYDAMGMIYAALSGCVTSAMGYVVWYWVRVRMAAITAGTVQLSVPVISAVLGVIVLGESLSLKSELAAIVVLLGVAITTRSTRAASKGGSTAA